MNDTSVMILIECSEEDTEEKEIETVDSEEGEEEKSVHFFYTSLHVNNSYTINNHISTNVFLDEIYSLALDIQLPPPENII